MCAIWGDCPMGGTRLTWFTNWCCATPESHTCGLSSRLSGCRLAIRPPAEVSVRTDHPGQPDQDVLPGHWQIVRAHYRVNARPDQFADVAIGYTLDHDAARGWFTRKGPPDGVAHDEDVQLGAVLRAHCPLGVKVQNGEMRSLCAA